MLIIGFLTVGGARDDLRSLMFWRPASMAFLAIAILVGWRAARNEVPRLLWLMLAIIALPLVHLVPLPSALWTQLPGRGPIAAIYRDAGIALPALPLSLAPRATWNALFSLAGPLAVLLLAVKLPLSRHLQLLTIIIAIGLASGLLGLLQSLGSPTGPLYTYAITNNGSGVGFFANRNHQAMLLLALMPMLAAWYATRRFDLAQLSLVRAIMFGLLAFLLPLLLVTGSRAGLLGLPVALLLAWWVYAPPVTFGRRVGGDSHFNPVWLAGAAIVMVLLIATIAAGRGEALNRLSETEIGQEMRVLAFPYVWQATMSYLPFGSGLGSFADVYKMWEPSALLGPNYFNHAHNDLLELAMTAGVPGVLLLLVAFGLFGVGGVRLVRARTSPGASQLVMARCGAAILLLLALGSVADYPLRVPSIMMLAACAAVWMAIGARGGPNGAAGD